jgi:hypothetical protein
MCVADRAMPLTTMPEAIYHIDLGQKGDLPMQLRRKCLIATMALWCTHALAANPSICDFKKPVTTEEDYINFGSLSPVSIPTRILNGAHITTFGTDLSVKLANDKTIDFQVETSRTLELKGLQINKIPALIASDEHLEELSSEHRKFIDEMRHSLATIITTERPCRLEAASGSRLAYVYHADDAGKETWLVQMTTQTMTDSYTSIVARGFSKEEFVNTVLQGAFLK